MKIEQSAGRISLVTYTDGWPLATSLRFDGDEIERLTVDQLHDLRYCINRQLARLPSKP